MTMTNTIRVIEKAAQPWLLWLGSFRQPDFFHVTIWRCSAISLSLCS